MEHRDIWPISVLRWSVFISIALTLIAASLIWMSQAYADRIIGLPLCVALLFKSIVDLYALRVANKEKAYERLFAGFVQADREVRECLPEQDATPLLQKRGAFRDRIKVLLTSPLPDMTTHQKALWSKLGHFISTFMHALSNGTNIVGLIFVYALLSLGIQGSKEDNHNFPSATHSIGGISSISRLASASDTSSRSTINSGSDTSGILISPDKRTPWLQLQPYDDAVLTDKGLACILTSDNSGKNQRGAAWENSQILDLDRGFCLGFTLKIDHSGKSEAADGAALVIGNPKSVESHIGGVGMGLGYGRMNNGNQILPGLMDCVAVEFDTFPNKASRLSPGDDPESMDMHDPSQNHVALMVPVESTGELSPDHAKSGFGDPVILTTPIVNKGPVDVIVNYRPGKLAILAKQNGSLIVCQSWDINLVSYIHKHTAYFGFTASTAISSSQHMIQQVYLPQ